MTAKQQVERLLALVPYLREREGVRLEDVANDFGVAQKQIQADLNVLWFCGLPGAMPGDLIEVDMEALEGEGVVHIDNTDFLDRPVRLDAHEALALTMALKTLRDVAGSNEREAIDRALAKLEAASGDALATADQVELRVDAADQKVVDTVNDALRHQRRLRLSYFVPARDETTEREVDPMRLVVAEGHSYLECWCYRADDVRLFRLDRISAATELDTPADPPEHAHPRDLSAGLFQPSADDMLATVDLDPHATWVADYYPHENIEERPGGGLRMRLRVSDPQWLVRLVLRLGGHAEVVIPTEIAAEVHEQATKALQAYEG
ncbi:MAG: WYL domain-containing protein [Propionibacteriales bacterium]|nr:WYL domain-containing protein [Propionibacteriales bacterium]